MQAAISDSNIDTSSMVLLVGKSRADGISECAVNTFGSPYALAHNEQHSALLPGTAVCSARSQQTRRVCAQVSRAEFILLWMTFVAIIYTDLETGIFAGVVFSVFYFAYSYAKVHLEHVIAWLGSMCIDTTAFVAW